MRQRNNLFDKKFGGSFIGEVPLCPGVYEMIDSEGATIYVGKSKRLRRRLQQYRNARRRKKHLKMRTILAEATSIRLHKCTSDLDAQLLENRLIQKHRPKFNIAGAFSFLYPLIGLRRTEQRLTLAYTTSPDSFLGYSFYGAYRSRHLTREGYFSLLRILNYIGHREPISSLERAKREKYSHTATFRQVGDHWFITLEEFLAGRSPDLLFKCVMSLLERPLARRNATEIQEAIDSLKRFYKFEAQPLRKALNAADLSEAHYVSQEERDRIFIRFRQNPKALKRSAVRSF